MAVTDRALCRGADGLVAAVEAAVSGGAGAVQLREKDPAGARLLSPGPPPRAGPDGLALIEEIAGAVRVPVLAIGGITTERVEEVVRAGASGVAVISAVFARRGPRAG